MMVARLAVRALGFRSRWGFPAVTPCPDASIIRCTYEYFSNIFTAQMTESSDPQRRELILRAAERLFQHYGYSKTTVADIAREAKVGVGSVYLEFPSKNDIVAELSLQRYRHVLEAMRKAAHSHGGCAERLKGIFDARIKSLLHFAREGHHGIDLLRCACPATESAHEHFRTAEEDLITEFLTEAAAASEFDVVEPRQIARVLLRLYDCYSPTTVGHIGLKQARREIAVAHALILHGLLVRKSGS